MPYRSIHTLRPIYLQFALASLNQIL
jgi:hypothetical protein